MAVFKLKSARPETACRLEIDRSANIGIFEEPAQLVGIRDAQAGGDCVSSSARATSSAGPARMPIDRSPARARSMLLQLSFSSRTAATKFAAPSDSVPASGQRQSNICIAAAASVSRKLDRVRKE